MIDKPGAIYRDRKSGKLIFVAEEFGPTKAAVEFDPKKTKGGINLIVSAFRVSDEASAGAVKGEEWEPIHYDPTDDYPRSMAALVRADVVMVNAIRDGLNLVAKEAALVNRRHAQILLSPEVGAWHELAEGA